MRDSGKCAACAKDYDGGVAVTAYEYPVDTMVTRRFCSHACAIPESFAVAIQTVTEQRDWYQREVTELREDLKKAKDALANQPRRRRR